MSLKLIQTLKSADGKQCAKVFRVTGRDVFVVKFYTEQSYRCDAGYYTEDKEDALSTAQTFVGN